MYIYIDLGNNNEYVKCYLVWFENVIELLNMY